MTTAVESQARTKSSTRVLQEATWYKDAIIYELHIKAFFDSNDDGIGDFQGMMQKLDYLQELGVTAIWLLPFYPSPLRDDGYDIADYYTINPAYGTIEDFQRFIEEAHKRKLKVITELVINHTSDQHPWFQRAIRSPKGSPERDFYVWSGDPDKYRGTRIIFTDTESSNWTFNPVAGEYYWHRFFSHQPDLNYDNPEVQKEIFSILDYWLDMGVDGFRLDAVPYLFEREGTNCENLPETHAFLKKLRKHVDEKYKNKLLLAEANMWPEDSVAYFGKGDECHMNYHFPIMPRMFMAVRMEDRYPISDIWDQTPDIPDNCQWGLFLRNHDELTLEMVTDEERDYMYKVYTKDVKARINVGIRHRLAPLLDNNRKKIELMNMLLFSLPGTPIIYYGDEIGMGDNYYLGDRNGVRTPMQWSSDRNAGFSKANPHKLYLPVIIDPEYSYEAVNVETQHTNLSSLWWWMKRVLAMRKRYKAFGRGSIRFLSPSNAKVIAFIREYKNEKILVIANLSRFAQAIELDLQDYKDYIPVEVFSRNHFPGIKDQAYTITITQHGYYWFELKKSGLNEEADLASKPQLRVEDLSQLQMEPAVEKLEDWILPKYMKTCRWFGGKGRTIQQVKISRFIEMEGEESSFVWLLLQVYYNEGLSEQYQIPLAFATGEEESRICNEYRKAVVAKIELAGEEGILYDAAFSEDFQRTLFKKFSKERHVLPGTGLVFMADKGIVNYLSSPKEWESRILSAEQSNSSIVYNGSFFLKLYRKIDESINPDTEVVKMLSEKSAFHNIPHYMGELQLQNEGRRTLSLAMVQELVPNQGDAWELMNDVFSRYIEKVEASEKEMPALKGSLYEPLPFEETTEEIQELIGAVNAERASQLGKRTAEMHIALASITDEPDFVPEDFSLHYQRSLYSSLQSLVRGSYSDLTRNLPGISKKFRKEAEAVLDLKGHILDRLKLIFDHKMDALKIRNHGDYHLGQVLFTGKDFVIVDFEGEPARSFSERRLKRSALRDVAGMLRSFHYVAYNQLIQNPLHHDNEKTEAWADLWYHYMGSFFMHSYLEEVKGKALIPSDTVDLKIMLDTFILEKAIYELGYELNNRPAWSIIPLKGILYIMNSLPHETEISQPEK